MDKLFQIGSFCFRLICPTKILIPNNFQKFAAALAVQPQYIYRLNIVETLPEPQGKLVTNRQDLNVYETSSGEERIIGIKGRSKPYAQYREISEREAQIFFLAEDIKNLQVDTIFTSLFALERRMIQRDSLVLHCAYVVFKGQAILFSAPSETGKSTQAALWEKYRGSKTLNGDRALLRQIDGNWTACGLPVCGSSEICYLRDTPVHSIVMLKQGKMNKVEPLSPIQAFSALYSQITINQWNKDYVQKAIENIENLIKQIPVWQLTCDISEEAVQCLETVLFPDSQEKGDEIRYEI